MRDIETINSYPIVSMKIIKNYLPEVLTLMLLFSWVFANSQVTIDNDLALKLDYMAWKSRQLDSTNVQLIEKNKGLKQLLRETETLTEAFETENKVYAQLIASLQINNDLLNKRMEDIWRVANDCERKNEKLQVKIDKQNEKLAKVISSRDTHAMVNIGLGFILIGTLGILLTN